MALTVNRNLDILFLNDSELESFANINLVGRDFNKYGSSALGTIIKIEKVHTNDRSQRFIVCRLSNGDLYMMQDIEYFEHLNETEHNEKYGKYEKLKDFIGMCVFSGFLLLLGGALILFVAYMTVEVLI